MQDNNPYSAPSAAVADIAPAGRQELAGRGMRLGGAIIDALILLVILIPLMVMGGYFSGMLTGQQPGFGTQLMWAALGFVIFVLVQGYPLSQSGQTWGKKALKMKIVDLDGRQPSFGTLIGKRYLPVQLISAVPFVGGLFGLVNVLFIFREDRRCIHDLIAGTRVVVAD
jgi:uncharacterized RDD family membrane protein YckC